MQICPVERSKCQTENLPVCKLNFIAVGYLVNKYLWPRLIYILFTYAKQSPSMTVVFGLNSLVRFTFRHGSGGIVVVFSWVVVVVSVVVVVFSWVVVGFSGVVVGFSGVVVGFSGVVGVIFIGGLVAFKRFSITIYWASKIFLF